MILYGRFDIVRFMYYDETEWEGCNMFDLVGEVRNLITAVLQIDKTLKELVKTMKEQNGGTKK